MKNFKLALALSGVLFLAVLAISPLKDFFAEWKGYQHRYNELLLTLPERVAPVQIGIKQLWVQKLQRVDRCGTCHLGISQPALADAPEPFRTHPRIYHDPEDFGCTTCHGGQGRATTKLEAHGDVEYWETPVLPLEYAESSCGTCHKEADVPRAPVLTRGRQLIQEYNCAGCHKIQGIARQWVPDLDGIGAKVNRAWLVDWLKDPKTYLPSTKMPNFHLSDDEANTLADFLMTFAAFPGNARLDSLPAVLTSANQAQRAKLSDQGATLFREARCISCHPVNGRGGYLAPDLGKVASKVNEAWLYTYIGNPKLLQPGVSMPRFRLNPAQRAEVDAYMEGEYADFGAAKPAPHTPDPAFYEKGLALFKKYNCAGCHGLSGVRGAEEMGPELTFVGSRKLYEIDFGASGIGQTLPSYFFTKLKKPRVFSASMKMPDFGFTDDDARAIAVALLANTDDPVPRDLRVEPEPASTYTPQGEFGRLVNDLSCFSCHSMEGRGGTLAPPLSLEASQAQRRWIEGYFKVPYSLRPILTERMPDLFLTDSEIKTIVDYMEVTFVVDSLQHSVPQGPAEVAEGRSLYFDKYGCQSCHQIGQKGGYVGPPLDNAGGRLTPGWVYHWLMDPKQYRPSTIEPTSSMSGAEAGAITAYLMTLKTGSAR